MTHQGVLIAGGYASSDSVPRRSWRRGGIDPAKAADKATFDANPGQFVR